MQQFIQRLQCMPERIRNITIVAHIDHGKTTLADTLLSTNEIVNQKQQGKQRFLDYLPIEQERLITVKSSSVSLVHMTDNYFACSRIKKDNEVPKKGFFLTQLYDSPGHVDFTHEVLTSLSMSDGAVFVVDAVEGLRTQSQNLLKSLLRLKIELVLVINKIDKLFIELKMTAFEVFIKIQQIIADTNNYIETLNLDINEYFCITKNVMITSAYNGWGVSLLQFVYNLPNIDPRFKNYSTNELLEFLGQTDAYMNANGEIKQGKPQNCLYVKYILEPLMKIYELTEYEKELDNNIKKLLKIHKIFTGRTFSSQSQQKVETYRTEFLFDIFPLGKQLLDLVVYNIPDPIHTQNQFIVQIEKQINALQPFQFIGIIGKHLTDIDIDEPVQHSNGQQRCFYLLRIIWMGQQGDYSSQELLYGDGIMYHTNKNQSFNIINIYQPLERLFKHINYSLIAQGNIIGIETNVPIRNNSVVVGSFTIEQQADDQDNELDLGQLCVRASNKCSKNEIKIEEIPKAIINDIQQIYMDLQEDLLQYEKPLIKVCLIPEKIEQYNDLCTAVKNFCDTQMSVGWELSRNGDITLFVCGDVHLDLCLEAIKETINFEFGISPENLQIYETYGLPDAEQFTLQPQESVQEVLFEYNKMVLDYLRDSDDVKKLQNLPTLSSQQRDTFLPYYFEFLGQNQPIKPCYGMEIALLVNDQVEKIKILVSLGSNQRKNIYNYQQNDNKQTDEQSDRPIDELLFTDDLNNKLFIHSSVPDKLKAVLRLAFKFNMSQGVLSLEPVRDCSLTFQCEHQGVFSLTTEIINSQYPHFFVKPGIGVLSVLNDISYFIRSFLTRLRPRIVEQCSQVVVTTSATAQQGVQRLLKRCRASNIQYFGAGSDGDVVLESHAIVPQEYCISLGRQLRAETAGAGTVHFLTRTLRENEDDPRGTINIVEDEDEQTITDNNATRLLERILTQKGLFIGEVVEAAEKQRTRRK